MNDYGNRSGGMWWKSTLVLAIGLVILGAVFICRQPLIEDEVEFAEVAQSYVGYGMPLAHVSGEVGAVVHHPQLYHAMLSVASMAGGAEWGGRFFGVLCLLVSAWLAGLLAKQIWRESHVGMACAVMVMLCPLCFRGAVLLDIDNTMLPIWCLGFLLVMVKGGVTPGRGRLIALMVLLTLALWTKLTTSLFLVIPLGILWGKAWWKSIAWVAGGGMVLFAITWLGFCLWRGLDPMAPLAHLGGRGMMGIFGLGFELGKRLVRYVLWLSPFLAGLLLMPIPKAQEQRAVLALGVFAIFNLVFYWVVGGDAFGFPRYQVTAVLVAMVLLAPAMAKGWETMKCNLFVKWLFLLGSVVLLWLGAGDGFYPFYTYPEMAAMGKVDNLDLAFRLGRIIVAVILVGAVIVVIQRSKIRSVRSGIAIISAVILLPWWISQNVAMATASYNTAYLYGETGIKEAARILEKSLPDGAMMVASKDVAYHTGYRYPHRVLGEVCKRRELLRVLKGTEVQALVYRDSQWIDDVARRGLRAEAVQQELRGAFFPYHVGSFHIWFRSKGFQAEVKPCP